MKTVSLYSHPTFSNKITDEREYRKKLYTYDEILQIIDKYGYPQEWNSEGKYGQEHFVFHPIRSLAQTYVYRNQCQPFGIYKDNTMIGYVMVIYDYDIQEYNIWHVQYK